MRLTAHGKKRISARWTGWVGISGAAVLLVAGCASSQAATLPSPTPATLPSPTPAASVDPMKPTGLPAWAADSIESPVPRLSTAGSGTTSLPWRLVSTTDGGRGVQVIYVAGDGDCTTFAGFDVVETAESVTITARATTDTGRTACAAMIKDGAGTITLEKPLGDRTLVHAAVSPQWVNAQP